MSLEEKVQSVLESVVGVSAIERDNLLRGAVSTLLSAFEAEKSAARRHGWRSARKTAIKICRDGQHTVAAHSLILMRLPAEWCDEEELKRRQVRRDKLAAKQKEE